MKQFKTVIILLSFILPITSFAQNIHIKRLDGSRISTAEVEQTVTRLMREAHVTGLSLAILNDNKIAYVKSFGYRNKEASLPLTENTVMYGASFTKSVFACLVMQLVSEGVIDLDKPIYQYFPKPLPKYEKYQDLAGDEPYKLLTMRMLLSHTTGFPNFRVFTSNGKLNINFTPGTKYAYSGEGINLAQFVVETVTKKDVGEMIQERIFKPFGMTRTGMTWDDKFKPDVAFGYDENEKSLGHNLRKSVRAAGSMDTTISDFARFMEAVMQGKALTKKARHEMLKPQIQIYSAAQFPSLNTVTTEENRAIKLAYGLGWGLFQSPYGQAYFKEGHDDGWENHAVAFPDKKIAIVLMANSSNGDSIFKELLETIIKDKSTPWKWENYVPYNLNGRSPNAN